MIPENLKYTKDHEWIRVEGSVGVVGITDHAQEALGDVVFVDLPVSGKSVAQGEEACSIESSKAASSIYAPVSGTVKAANEELTADPSLVNSDPYGKGWVYTIEVSNPADLENLLSPQQYQELL
ncbi:MAG: glycine cleavage system protein GcvH [Phycisphaerae bacterium]|nr:glycine cleavage system protein GcvH [Phycisphaerae bacterium]